MEFNERLRELRKNEKMYQKEIAKFLNVRVATISAWEKGINEPDIETLKKLASFFDVTLDYLVGYKEYDYSFEYQHDNTRLVHKEKK